MSQFSQAKNRTVVIYSHGDSQGEVMDYCFMNDPRYVTMEEDSRVGWRSGWSARGLTKGGHIERIVGPILDLKHTAVKHVVVFLSFGSTDIDWNLSYKRDVKKEKGKADVGDCEADVGNMNAGRYAYVDWDCAEDEGVPSACQTPKKGPCRFCLLRDGTPMTGWPTCPHEVCKHWELDAGKCLKH